MQGRYTLIIVLCQHDLQYNYSLNFQSCTAPVFEKNVSYPKPSVNPHYIMNNAQNFQMTDNDYDWVIVDHLQTLKAYTAYFKQEGASYGKSVTYTKIVEISEELDNIIIPILDPLKVRMSVVDRNCCISYKY